MTIDQVLNPFSAEAHAAASFFEAGRRLHSDALGWWQQDFHIRYAPKGGLWTCKENDDLVAVAIAGGSKNTTRIFAIYTRPDARRLAFALALADRIQLWGAFVGRPRLKARVAADLPDVPFWLAAGFTINKTTPGGTRRRRSILHMVREQHDELAFPLLARNRQLNTPPRDRLRPLRPV